MPITDPQAIAFSEETIRPMAEMLRWLKHTGEVMKAGWDGGTSAHFTGASGENVSDSNGSKHPFTGADATNIQTRVNDILAILQAPSAMDSVNAACVRPLVSSSGPGG